MTASPFIYMACSLTLQPVTTRRADAEQVPTGLSRTERIRRLLKAAARPMTAEEITWDMDAEFPNFGVHLVWLLLKYDISKGRVTLDNGRYAWSHEYDSAEAEAIRAALKLLKGQGYIVKAPRATA